jgi:uncharacterized protein (DUF433 family)
MATTMDVIVGGEEKAIDATVSNSLPEYHGGVTMTIQCVPFVQPSSATIIVDPDVRGGVPCVSDGHWPISHILQELASGVSPARLVEKNPGLTLVDIQTALDVSAWVMRDPAIDWSALNLSDMIGFRHEMEAWQSLSDDSLERTENEPED